ncbi:MAG TPA: hypothetical protein VKF81_07650 [Blastocatellia bacterium]|nr:hypothetical protein [Blastocatellia bacterium]
MSQPRIAIFARAANGSVEPKRVITGQASKLGRTVHGIAYDAVHDEIIVPNALADAVLVFRGSANGAEPPIRVIQGPCTQLVTPHSVSLDLDHNELLVSSLTGKTIYSFALNSNGNVAPLRVIKGPKTRLGHVVGLGVDTVNDVLVVANTKDLLFFKRTDNGDVAPLASLEGPNTGIGDEPWQLHVYKGKIFVAASNHLHQTVYSAVTLKGTFTKVPEDPWLDPNLGFIGVWNVTDRGDVAPRAIIKGPFSGLLHPIGLALNPPRGEIYVSDSVRNGLMTFLVPDFFPDEKGSDTNKSRGQNQRTARVGRAQIRQRISNSELPACCRK